MKNKFYYDSQRTALEAFIQSFEGDFENIIFEVDYWLRELIRDSPDDENWVNGFLTYVGENFENDFYPTLAWFSIEANYPDLWTSKSYSLIKKHSKKLLNIQGNCLVCHHQLNWNLSESDRLSQADRIGYKLGFDGIGYGLNKLILGEKFQYSVIESAVYSAAFSKGRKKYFKLIKDKIKGTKEDCPRVKLKIGKEELIYWM